MIKNILSKELYTKISVCYDNLKGHTSDVYLIVCIPKIHNFFTLATN